MKESLNFRQIQRDLYLLHTRKVKVGNINHSVGTISKMKKHLASAVQDLIKSKLKTPLKCTGKLRPLQETVDKMTLFHTTSQMQVCIAPLLNEHELFTSLYIKSYPVERFI